VARPSLSIAAFAFFRFVIASLGQAWQWRHSDPFWQPCGFQNHAQGRHSPLACFKAPRLGVPGGGTKPDADRGRDEMSASSNSSSRSEMSIESCSEPVQVVDACSEPDVGDSSLSLGPRTNLLIILLLLEDFGVTKPSRVAADLAWFEFLVSAIWQASWQFVQSLPFAQPVAFPKNTHGRHDPYVCNTDP